MVSHAIVAHNALGEVHPCPCGGVRMRLAGAMVHIAASDVPLLVQLASSAQRHVQARHATAPTPSHQDVTHVPQMTPEEAARFGAEGPIRKTHAGPCNRTLH